MFTLQGVKYGSILDIDQLAIDGRFTIISGESGSGKSTLLRLLNKMISPDKGEILYRGQNLDRIDTIEHRRRVTMLSQNPVLFEKTLRDNLTYMFTVRGLTLPTDRYLEKLLSGLKLRLSLDQTAEKLSGGERQRVGLARLLACPSEVLLLDEPSSALDEETEEIIMDRLKQEAEDQGRRVIMITHRKDLIDRYADRLILVKEGRIEESRVIE